MSSVRYRCSVVGYGFSVEAVEASFEVTIRCDLQGCQQRALQAT